MKKFSFLITLIFVCFIFVGCKRKEESDFKVVTSCYPVYIMTLNVAKGASGVEVVNMCENSVGCLHDFQLRSEDLKKIERSSAFVVNGAGMESFLDKIISELPKVKLIDSSKGVKLLSGGCHHDSHEEDDGSHEHCHHEVNPHTWLSVSNYIRQVENIAQQLCLLDPKNKEVYQQNAASYKEKLEALKVKISSQLEKLGDKDIITFHDAFPYFAEEFGLNIVGVINHEPGQEPSVKEVKEITELIKSKNVKNIFAEPQYPQKTAETISQETGARIFTLDPAVTGPDSLESYLNAMEENLKVLSEALK